MLLLHVKNQITYSLETSEKIWKQLFTPGTWCQCATIELLKVRGLTVLFQGWPSRTSRGWRRRWTSKCRSRPLGRKVPKHALSTLGRSLWWHSFGRRSLCCHLHSASSVLWLPPTLFAPRSIRNSEKKNATPQNLKPRKHPRNILSACTVASH